MKVRYKGVDVEVGYYVEEADPGTWEGGSCISPPSPASVVAETAEIGGVDVTEMLEPDQWEALAGLVEEALREN